MRITTSLAASATAGELEHSLDLLKHIAPDEQGTVAEAQVHATLAVANAIVLLGQIYAGSVVA